MTQNKSLRCKFNHLCVLILLQSKQGQSTDTSSLAHSLNQQSVMTEVSALLLICTSRTTTGHPQNSVLIRRV